MRVCTAAPRFNVPKSITIDRDAAAGATSEPLPPPELLEVVRPAAVPEELEDDIISPMNITTKN